MMPEIAIDSLDLPTEPRRNDPSLSFSGKGITEEQIDRLPERPKFESATMAERVVFGQGEPRGAEAEEPQPRQRQARQPAEPAARTDVTEDTAPDLAEVDAAVSRALQQVETIRRQAPPPFADPRPTRAQFDDPDRYEEALTSWAKRDAVREAHTAAAVQAETAAQAQAHEAVAARWAAHQAHMETEHPDFQEVTFKNTRMRLSEGVGVMLLRAENGPELMYALGKDPEAAARLSAIADPLALATEFGKFAAAAQYARAGAPAPRQTASRSSVSEQTMTARQSREPDMDAYAAKRNAEIAAARGRHRMFLPPLNR